MIGKKGQNFASPDETWEITRALAFIEIDGRKVLHQLFVSSMGRAQWKAVPDISREFAETGRT